MGKDATVYQAEAAAIHNALLHLITHHTEGRKILRQTDSLAAVQTLNNLVTTSSLFNEIKQYITELTLKTRFTSRGERDTQT